MKQEKHKIRCSEIEKRLGKYCFFEKSYKNTRTTKNPQNLWDFGDFLYAQGKLEEAIFDYS